MIAGGYCRELTAARRHLENVITAPSLLYTDENKHEHNDNDSNVNTIIIHCS